MGVRKNPRPLGGNFATRRLKSFVDTDIVESGTYLELISRGGLFEELAKRQVV